MLQGENNIFFQKVGVHNYSPGQSFCRTSGHEWQLLITQLLIG